jgi:hypothetical protein
MRAIGKSARFISLAENKMKVTHRGSLVFVALVTAAVSAAHCGGDDTTSGGGTSGGGNTGTGGSSAGASGSMTGAGGAAGSATGAGGAAGATGGASGSGGSTGTGGAVGDSGIKDGAVREAGACPQTPPAEDTVCTAKQACPYPALDCNCARVKGGDAGRVWTCVAVDDGGVVPDAEACPATINDGDACTTKGQRCPQADGGAKCVCSKDVWNCP